jgi:hypothetical protein
MEWAAGGIPTNVTAPTMNHQIDLVIAVSPMLATNAKGRTMAAIRRIRLVAYVQSARIIRAIHVATYAARAAA